MIVETIVSGEIRLEFASNVKCFKVCKRVLTEWNGFAGDRNLRNREKYTASSQD
jgi:hypothetical protein